MRASCACPSITVGGPYSGQRTAYYPSHLRDTIIKRDYVIRDRCTRVYAKRGGGKRAKDAGNGNPSRKRGEDVEIFNKLNLNYSKFILIDEYILLRCMEHQSVLY